MAQPTKDKSLPSLVTELWELVVTYLRQETVNPLKSLGKFVGLGLIGSILLSIGVVLVLLAGLRALQTETGGTFDGDWSWAPYLIVLLAAGIIAALAARAIGSEKRRGPR